MPSDRTPDIRGPASQEQNHQREEADSRDHSISGRLFPKESLLALRKHHGPGHALLPAPLEVTQIWRAPRHENQDAGHYHGASRHGDVQDDNIVIGIVVGVLDHTSHNADDDVDAAGL